ncbi:MAG: alpha/beta fold hydrolase [Gemmatimonadota bacterium]
MDFSTELTVVRGQRIYSLRAGSGPPVILLHGLAGSSRWWRYVMPALADHFTTYAPDLVGFGRSRGMPATLDETAALVAEWLEACGLERAHLIGHSMGGQIAIHLAARHSARVDRLVLVSAAGIPRPVSLAHAARFLAELVPPRAWSAPHFLPRIAFDALRAGPRSLARATASILRDDVRPLLPLVRARTLLVWGGLDPLTPLRAGEVMAQGIADARLVVFDDAAHIPMIDQPARFNAEVLRFLRT